MKLVDSSGWIELFTDGPLADAYAMHLRRLEEVVTPTIVLYEVYKLIKRARSEEEAIAAIAQLHKTRVCPLTEVLALEAADLSLEHRLAMADAIVYATAQQERAELVTSDDNFESLPGVTYLAKRAS